MVKVSTFLAKAAELQNVDMQYPVPERPEGNHHYTFPINADRLTDMEIDGWLLFLGAWRSHLAYQIARLEGEQSVLTEVFDLLMSSKVATLEKESEKRLLKDSLKGQALAEDDQLQQGFLFQDKYCIEAQGFQDEIVSLPPEDFLMQTFHT